MDALRAGGGLTLSLVATMDERVVGHLAFSPVSIAGRASEPAVLALAPVAVHPDQQKQGIGIALIEAGLAEVRWRGHPGVIVLGHPEYYPRFGFTRASQFGIECPFPVPDDAFLALELRAGALAGQRGVVGYRPEFAAL